MSDNPRTVGERIEALRILLTTGTPAQQSIARKALKDLAQTTRKTADIEAATKALAGNPEAPKDSAGVVMLPEAPVEEFNKQISSDSTFSPSELVGRKLVGLEVKPGQRTLLDRAEAREPKAFADLRRLYFYHCEVRDEEPEPDVDRWAEFEVIKPPGQTGLSPAERMRELTKNEKYVQPRMFTLAEKERASRILGDQKMVCRLLRGSVERYAETLATNSVLWYEIIRLLDEVRARSNDIHTLRELEAAILQAQDAEKLRVVLYAFLGQPVQDSSVARAKFAELEYPSPPEWNRHRGGQVQ